MHVLCNGTADSFVCEVAHAVGNPHLPKDNMIEVAAQSVDHLGRCCSAAAVRRAEVASEAARAAADSSHAGRREKAPLLSSTSSRMAQKSGDSSR